MAIEGMAIRRAEPEDAPAFYEIYSTERAQRNTLQLPYPSAAMWRKRLAEPDDSPFTLVAEIEGRVVGAIGIMQHTQWPRRRHVGSIFMAVHDDWQGKGVGTALMEAAIDLAENWLGLTRIELEVYADNERAIGLYERFGFVLEGTMREHTLRDGRLIDTLSMARLRSSK